MQGLIMSFVVSLDGLIYSQFTRDVLGEIIQQWN